MTPEQIRNAKDWRGAHREHVVKLLTERLMGGVGYPPTGSDRDKPDLWKAEHWAWFIWAHGN